MRLTIAQGVTVWIDDKEFALLQDLVKDDFNSDKLDDESYKRLQSLIRKDVVRRKRKSGQASYEIRRDIAW